MPLITYSPKVFIPLTKLCRDVCHYCTFAGPPRRGERAYLTLDEVLEIARAGRAAGCREALFTLGDKPELRYRVAPISMPPATTSAAPPNRRRPTSSWRPRTSAEIATPQSDSVATSGETTETRPR